MLPLTHTVSFYRKQQNQISNTPVRHIMRQQPAVVEEPEEVEEEGGSVVEAKIKELMEEVCCICCVDKKKQLSFLSVNSGEQTTVSNCPD